MERFQLGSAFQVGRSHMMNKTLCQDRAAAVKEFTNIVLVLSDGMGSYPYSDLGSQFVVDWIRRNSGSFYSLLNDYNWSDDPSTNIKWKREDGEKRFTQGLIDLLKLMQHEASIYAGQIGTTIDQMHCTLSFSIIGPSKMMNVAIGDSPLYIMNDLSENPDRDKIEFMDGNQGFSGGGTVSALDIDGALSAISVSIGFPEDIKAVLLMSDGCFGFQKEELEKEVPEDFPSWFYDIIHGKVSAEDVCKKLRDKGYDDCSFAYYVSDTSMLNQG